MGPLCLTAIAAWDSVIAKCSWLAKYSHGHDLDNPLDYLFIFTSLFCQGAQENIIMYSLYFSFYIHHNLLKVVVRDCCWPKITRCTSWLSGNLNLVFPSYTDPLISTPHWLNNGQCNPNLHWLICLCWIQRTYCCCLTTVGKGKVPSRDA